MNKAEVIYRVLSDVASDREREELEHWLAQSDANRREYEDLELLHRLSGIIPDSKDEGHYGGLDKIRRAAKRRITRTARVQRVGRFAGAATCVILAVFLWSHATVDSRPASLHFKDQTLRQVLPVVERAYGIEVRVEEDALESCRFTGIFYRVEQPDDVVRSISKAISADFEFIAPGKYRLLVGGC